MSGLDGGSLFGSLLDFSAGILAQEAPVPPAGGETARDPSGGLLQMLPLFVLIYIVFYFLLIRPQRKQQKQHEALLKDLKKNDSVRTSGGIFGKVVSIHPDQDQVVLEVDENKSVRLKVLRSSIVAVIGREKKDEAPAATTAGQSR
jgi:preprotein translocase subunit YajC